MARTARRDTGEDALSTLMAEAGAAPRRRGPRGPKHRAPETTPGPGRIRRISAFSAGGLLVGGLVAVLLVPADAADVVPGTPLLPPSLTIAPQAIDAPAPSPAPSGPSGGSVAPPPPMTASMHGSETPSPTPAPEPEERPDPRAGHHDFDQYYDQYYDWYYGGGHQGGRWPQWGR